MRVIALTDRALQNNPIAFSMIQKYQIGRENSEDVRQIIQFSTLLKQIIYLIAKLHSSLLSCVDIGVKLDFQVF